MFGAIFFHFIKLFFRFFLTSMSCKLGIDTFFSRFISFLCFRYFRFLLSLFPFQVSREIFFYEVIKSLIHIYRSFMSQACFIFLFLLLFLKHKKLYIDRNTFQRRNFFWYNFWIIFTKKGRNFKYHTCIILFKDHIFMLFTNSFYLRIVWLGFLLFT